jgi:hypothetical protein
MSVTEIVPLSTNVDAVTGTKSTGTCADSVEEEDLEPEVLDVDTDDTCISVLVVSVTVADVVTENEEEGSPDSLTETASKKKNLSCSKRYALPEKVCRRRCCCGGADVF